MKKPFEGAAADSAHGVADSPTCRHLLKPSAMNHAETFISDVFAFPRKDVACNVSTAHVILQTKQLAFRYAADLLTIYAQSVVIRR